MIQDVYPTGKQLGQRLFAAGIISAPPTTTEAQADLDGAAAAAADTWESLTGYQPFLADANDTTHHFYPDGSTTLDLTGGFVSITSVSVNGTVQTANAGYRTYPLNAGVNGKPITYLKFDTYWGSFLALYSAYPGNVAPVAVTGRRGAYAVLPALAIDGILALAVQDVLGDFEFAKFRGMKGWVIGSDERTYDQQAFGRYMAALQQNVDRAVGRFRRPKIG